jgi:hypothetical protein
MLSVIGGLGYIALGSIAARGSRRAYVAFVLLGLLFMPARAEFQLAPFVCEMTFSGALALHSLTNYNHILLFGCFSVMTLAQFSASDPSRHWKAAVLVLGMSMAVELEQALFWKGHCRARDLIPNTLGFCFAMLLVGTWSGIRGKLARRSGQVADERH